MKFSRVLIARLPCQKVYPAGPLYLASLLHRVAPDVEVSVLDLALAEDPASALDAAIREHRADLVAFSWRDIQVLSPLATDAAMRDAFAVDHDPSLPPRAVAQENDVSRMRDYCASISRNLALIEGAARNHESVAFALGGPGAQIFGAWLRDALPSRVRLFAETDLQSFFAFVEATAPTDPIEPELDHVFLEKVFPAWPAYRSDTISIQTKRGCPFSCIYCVYGYLEGKTVRRRDPGRVMEELRGYAQRWGARHFYFADAQLLSGAQDRQHLTSILERMCDARLDVEWSGYLRLSEVDEELASLMVKSGVGNLEVSLNSGSQEVVDRLRLGFSVEDTIRGCANLKAAGYEGTIYLSLVLNPPGATLDSLRETLAAVRRIKGIFGDGSVVPALFFLAIQPRTELERIAIDEGSLRPGYNPLCPTSLTELVYNPRPLRGLIGRACARAHGDAGAVSAERVLRYLEEDLSSGLGRAPSR